MRLSAAPEAVGAAAADGRTGISPAGARAQRDRQREQDADRPGSHVPQRHQRGTGQQHSVTLERKLQHADLKEQRRLEVAVRRLFHLAGFQAPLLPSRAAVIASLLPV